MLLARQRAKISLASSYVSWITTERSSSFTVMDVRKKKFD